MHRRFMSFAIVALASCAPPTISLRPEAGSPSASLALDVTTKLTGVEEPIRVKGARFAFTQIEPALSRAVLLNAAPWAGAHKAQGRGGYQLEVDVVKGDASVSGGRLGVSLAVRATLRAVVGRAYIAQTQAFCDASGEAGSDAEARDVMNQCIAHLGQNVAGWLDGVHP